MPASSGLLSSAGLSQYGIEVQGECGIIACMLISLWTGREPTIRTHELVGWYFCGMADEEELGGSSGSIEDTVVVLKKPSSEFAGHSVWVDNAA